MVIPEGDEPSGTVMHNELPSFRNADDILPLIFSAAEPDQPIADEITLKKESERQRRSMMVLHIMLAVIICNTLQLGAENQFRAEDYPWLGRVYHTLDIAFSVCYVAEVSFGLYENGLWYFSSAWNIADVCITTFGVVDLAVGSKHNVVRASRTFRLLRIMRILRVVKVMKAVPDLVIVLEGLARSMQALFWVILLMTFLIYVFAIILVVALDDSLFPDEHAEKFSDIGHAMMTLTDMAILDEWGDIVRPVMDHQPILLPLFFFFLIVTSFGMMNVMIGVIVDSTQSAKVSYQQQENIQRVQRASQIWKEKIRGGGLSTADIEASEADFERKLNMRSEVIKEICQMLVEDDQGIPFPGQMQASDIIELLDFNADGYLCHDEFVSGLMRILEADPFQLTCLILTMCGKIRQETRIADERDSRRFDSVLHSLSALSDKVDALSEKVSASK